ncbi:hypothetical protein JVU11DRAFT_4990 [Chiua virens]|nr:hypothetical protein JVU11DRAFT_4990 [Chiua virens]
MSDLARVRTEIKSWERDFASTHGRDPSVQDIREQPDIADKYKLYKKLSKTLPPSTPPRSNRLPAPKSRALDAVPPLPGFNPFSPVKKSAKHISPRSSSHASAHANPFATPAKNKSKHRPRTATPSPYQILSASPTLPNLDASSSHAPASSTAVSRARKRLRGEPVSPSPNKPKRQRIRSQALAPVLKLDKDSSESELEVDQELPQCDFASSFVADSPIKAPAGGKSFKLLFDDALPALATARKPVGSSAAQLDSSPNAGLSRTASIDPPSLDPPCDSKSKSIASGPEDRLARPRGKMIFPAKDHHLSVSSQSLPLKTVVSVAPQPRTSMKRALDTGDSPLDNPELNTPLQSRYSLIPPSPPQDAINRNTGKPKAKTAASRKKLRVEDDGSDEGADSPDDFTFKVATVRSNRTNHSPRHVDGLDCDLLLHPGTRNHEAANEQFDADHHASGTFTVELPDKFRRVLAISPSRRQNNSEERVVRGLLYGRRVGHYDPSRGGDIWDAGETDDGTLGDAENEDDWEGEPVPWEVGEL